jgi:hypothetical protein
MVEYKRHTLYNFEEKFKFSYSGERGGKVIRPLLFLWKLTIQKFPILQYENAKATSVSCCNSMPVVASSSKAKIRIFPNCLANYTRHRYLGKNKRPVI